MQTDRLERTLRDALRDRLDHEVGPHPAWTGSPAARRITEIEGRTRRAPLRLLAVAALLGAGIAAALLAGAPMQPAVHANGWVAYTTFEQGDSGDPDTDIWFAGAGQQQRRVVGSDTDNIDQACPAFSPDGRRLAYGIVDGLWSTTGAEVPQWPAYRNAAVVIADVADDGSVDARQTFDVGEGVALPCPIWSPSGDRVAFGVPRTSPINPTRSGEGSEVWVLRTADGNVAVIPDLLAADLQWSPDGTSLAIIGGTEHVDQELSDARIYMYDLSSGTLRALDAFGTGGLTWSPDGQRIAYAARDGLRLIEVRTGEQQVLTLPYGAVHGIGPIWSPDGKTIAYQRVISGSGESHEVVLVSPDDRSTQTGLATEVILPSNRRTADGASVQLYPWRVTWSPDGAWLLYVAWTYPNGGSEVTWAVAVPTDPNAPVVVLATNPLAYDTGDAMRVQYQVWQPRPAGSAIAEDSVGGGSR